jgi:hypothetical protein
MEHLQIDYSESLEQVLNVPKITKKKGAARLPLFRACAGLYFVFTDG